MWRRWYHGRVIENDFDISMYWNVRHMCIINSRSVLVVYISVGANFFKKRRSFNVEEAIKLGFHVTVNIFEKEKYWNESEIL